VYSECSEQERETKGRLAVLKDLDLAREFASQYSTKSPDCSGIHIGQRKKAELLSQLRKDIGLLVDCGVMDYSLLVGVVDLEGDSDDELILKSCSAATLARDQVLSYLENPRRQYSKRVLLSLTSPFRVATAPAIYLGKAAYSTVEHVISTIITTPYPYFGAEFCGVDGGKLSRIVGTRKGRRAVYYMGLIDFLQPWTLRKIVEKELKGVLGYDKQAISCVHPSDYASRFLDFIDAHVS